MTPVDGAPIIWAKERGKSSPVTEKRFSPADINRAGLLEAHGNHVREDGKQHEDGRCKTMGSHGVFPQVMPHDNTVDNAANGIGQFCIDQNQHGLQELLPAKGGNVA